MSKQSRWKVIKAAIILALVAVDIIVKVIVEKSLAENQSLKVIPGVINFTYVKNTGAAFSMFSNATIWLIVFSIILIAVIVFFEFKVKNGNGWYDAGFCLVMAGAIGNLYDRIFKGAVRDFIELAFMKFGIFNVADIMLTVGVICYFVFIIFYSEKKPRKEAFDE